MLSKGAGVALNPATNGVIVDQYRETSVEGIFACGNVRQVHELVDYVSEEAEIAGKAAAEYIHQTQVANVSIPLKTDGKIRYTVPQIITRKKDVTVYFRVGDVYKNVKIHVTDGDTVLLSKKKQKVAPGEMESITLKRELLDNVKELYFSLEEM